MTRKANFNLQGMLIAVAVLGLFAGLIGTMISVLGSGYDITGFDEEQINKYQVLDNLSATVETARSTIDAATVDKTWFDFLSGIFNTILTPFKFMYRSVSILFSLNNAVINDLGLLKIVGDFLITVLTIFVFIGIVMIKNYMGRRK